MVKLIPISLVISLFTVIGSIGCNQEGPTSASGEPTSGSESAATDTLGEGIHADSDTGSTAFSSPATWVVYTVPG